MSPRERERGGAEEEEEVQDGERDEEEGGGELLQSAFIAAKLRKVRGDGKTHVWEDLA